MSSDNNGLPETVCAPDTTQLFEPTSGRRIQQGLREQGRARLRSRANESATESHRHR